MSELEPEYSKEWELRASELNADPENAFPEGSYVGTDVAFETAEPEVNRYKSTGVNEPFLPPLAEELPTYMKYMGYDQVPASIVNLARGMLANLRIRERAGSAQGTVNEHSAARPKIRRGVAFAAGAAILTGAAVGLYENVNTSQEHKAHCSGPHETMVKVGQNATSRQIALALTKAGHHATTPQVRAENPSDFDVGGWLVPAAYDHAVSSKHGSTSICVHY